MVPASRHQTVRPADRVGPQLGCLRLQVLALAQIRHLEFFGAHNLFADRVFADRVRIRRLLLCQGEIVADIGWDKAATRTTQISPTQVQVEQTEHLTLINTAFLRLHDLEIGILWILAQIDRGILNVRGT